MRRTPFYSTAVLMLFCSFPSMAANIREQQYGYGYGDSVKAMSDDTFLVCADCEADKLSKLPRKMVQMVAIKMNPPEEREVEPPVQEQNAPAKPAESKKCGPDCLLGTLLFRFDSDRLRSAEKTKLDKIANSIPAGAKLTVTGYTCSIGPKEHNRKLSERRARKVAKYLAKKGAHISKVEGKGECCPVSKTKKLNRRVEIIEKERK